jgi:hypothetical protein
VATNCQANFERSAVPNADQEYFSLLIINSPWGRCARYVRIPCCERCSESVAIPKLIDTSFDLGSRTEGTEDTEILGLDRNASSTSSAFDNLRKLDARGKRHSNRLSWHHVSTAYVAVAELCPRRESNPDLRFRKPPFYPLNYGDS